MIEDISFSMHKLKDLLIPEKGLINILNGMFYSKQARQKRYRQWPNIKIQNHVLDVVPIHQLISYITEICSLFTMIS